MKKYFATVRDREGNSVAGAEVYIRDNDTNSLLTIYSDNGVTTTTNPLTTDNDGQCSAYVADGVLKVQIYIDGSLEQEKTGIQHYDDQDNEIKALRSVTSAADKGFYFTGSGTGGVFDLTAGGRALCGIGGAADTFAYYTSSSAAASASLTAFARTILDDADAATVRATLGLGTVATLASSTDGTLAANSDSNVATQKAVKTYVDAAVSAGVTYATASEVKAGTVSNKVISPSVLHSAHAIQTLTDGATISWDMSAGFNAKVTLGGNRTLSVSNPKEGLTYVLEVIQDATGSRTMTWPSSFNWGSAGAPTLSTATTKVDVVTLYCRDATTPKFRAIFNKDA